MPFVAALPGSLAGSIPLANASISTSAARRMSVRPATSNPLLELGGVTPDCGPGGGAPGAVPWPTGGRLPGVAEVPDTGGNGIRYFRCLRRPRRSNVISSLLGCHGGETTTEAGGPHEADGEGTLNLVIGLARAAISSKIIPVLRTRRV